MRLPDLLETRKLSGRLPGKPPAISSTFARAASISASIPPSGAISWRRTLSPFNHSMIRMRPEATNPR